MIPVSPPGLQDAEWYASSGGDVILDELMAVIVLGCAVLLAFYILFLYPLVLAFAPFRPAPKIAKDPRFHPAVTVIMAVYNGAPFLRRKLDSILALQYPRERMQILVVSDGSSDDTDLIVQEYASHGVRLLRQPHRGKAAAINSALCEAAGEVLFFTDARQPLNPGALAELAANFADPSVGAVSGELRLHAPESGEQADMDLYWRYEIWVRRRHSLLGSILGATGCIYAIRRALVEPLPPDTLSDDVMLPLGAFLRGYRVVFEPEAHALDQPAPQGAEFRRRWRTLAGLLQAHARAPRLLTKHHRMRLHFLSHKFARLVLPWALLAAVVASIALPASPGRTILLSLEAAFLLLAAGDAAVSKRWFLKRLTSPPRTFLLMNLAALAAWVVFVIPARRLWKPTAISPPRP